MIEPLVSIDNITLSYDGMTPVIQSLSLDVLRGQFIALLGPSGCGKTTLLRYLSGLMDPSEIHVSGKATVAGHDPFTRKQLCNRRLGFVFESPSLLPWLTVMENALLGFVVGKDRNTESKDIVMRLLGAVGLGEFMEYYPGQLSLGMQQRVAIVRCLAYKPSIIFLDTPFSGIDSQMKLKVLGLVSELIGKDGTVLLVTHDVTEATTLSDQVLVLSGSPTTIRSSIQIDLPRPRDVLSLRKSEQFALLEQRVWAAVLGEIVNA